MKIEDGVLIDCIDCGQKRSDEEIYYYEERCEVCEQAWHNRIESWRTGGREDIELDQWFSEHKPSPQREL